MARKPGTRRFVSDRVTVTIGSELGNAVNRLIRDVAGDVVDAIEAIVSETAKETRDKWYTLVRRRTGRSGDGTDYRLEIKGDTIRGVVFNDAKAFAKRDVNTNLQGQLLPGFAQKAEVFQATEEYYAYFVHAPEALSMVFQRSTLAEYRELMRYFRRTGALPPGYRASALTDSKGRRRPVGIAKLVRTPKAGDGKRVWDTLVVKGSKAIVKDKALALDRALMISGQKLAKG